MTFPWVRFSFHSNRRRKQNDAVDACVRVCQVTRHFCRFIKHPPAVPHMGCPFHKHTQHANVHSVPESAKTSVGFKIRMHRRPSTRSQPDGSLKKTMDCPCTSPDPKQNGVFCPPWFNTSRPWVATQCLVEQHDFLCLHDFFCVLKCLFDHRWHDGATPYIYLPRLAENN